MNKLLNIVTRLFWPKVRKIAFIDGDQSIERALAAYDEYVANTGTETHFVKMAPSGHNEPKAIRHRDDINRVYLQGTAGKEVVDKFIAGYIQRAVTEGYTHITVISGDYDFIDIFKMAAQIDSAANNITFRMIIPKALGRLATLPAQIKNIEIVKVNANA